MKTTATIKDVARDAGVSIKTVSRVINGEPHVTAKTREKVLTAVEALDFKINAAARALRSKAAKRLVLALDNPSQSYTEAVQINTVLACQPFSFELSLQGSPDIEALKLSMAEGELVGVVLAPPLSNDVSLLEALDGIGIPFVRVGAERGSDKGDKIGIDDRAASAEMTRYLIGLGHRRIGYVTGDAGYDVSRRRLLGFKDAIEDAGLKSENELIVRGDFSYASGLSCADKLLALTPRPTAIFASNDEMAAACLASAYKHGIRVPDALTIVGFDDAPFSRIIYPPLTTVHQSIREMMAQAVTILAARRSNPMAPLKEAVIAHSLKTRESSSAPPR